MMRLPWFEYRAPKSVAEAARILAAADAYQALTEPRPYRAAWRVDEAGAELQKVEAIAERDLAHDKHADHKGAAPAHA